MQSGSFIRGFFIKKDNYDISVPGYYSKIDMTKIIYIRPDIQLFTRAGYRADIKSGQSLIYMYILRGSDFRQVSIKFNLVGSKLHYKLVYTWTQ